MGDVETAVHPVGTAPHCVYALVLTLDGHRVLLSRHRERSTWETQGGHVEPGETTDEAAVRELYEEAGVIASSIEPMCDYWAHQDDSEAWGRLYVADVGRMDAIPDSEMAERRWFDALPAPELLTYPWMSPVLQMVVSSVTEGSAGPVHSRRR